MNSFQFDPFRSRLARDIRNNLSQSFLQALGGKDVAVFQSCAAEYMLQNLESGYIQYVKDRLARYEEAYRIIADRKLKKVLQQAPVLWDLGLNFEMHELLEPEWKKAEGDRRRALQGLIRAAGMKIHAENNNEKAAVSMGAKALADLARYGHELRGLDTLQAIMVEIKQALTTSQSMPGVD